MKYRYYTVNVTDSTVSGTNDAAEAESAAYGDDNFVIDAQNGFWLIENDSVAVLGDDDGDSEE